MGRRSFGPHTVSRDHKRLYRLWHNMLSRCNKSGHRHYKHYGGRGIGVCPEWSESPVQFCAWALENGYADNLTLDRIDPNAGYTPTNCRWIPMEEQSGNRQNRQMYTAWGENKSASDWLKDQRCVIKDRRLIRSRVFYRGWIPEEAMTRPVTV